MTVASRFRGPSASANGGYMCGRVAAYTTYRSQAAGPRWRSAPRASSCVDGPVTVTLRQPPPLATPMTVETSAEGSVRVHQGGTLIAEAEAAPDGPGLSVPRSVTAAQARAAAGGSPYFRQPVFPACFVCGMDRRPGDGLRIMPGPVADRAVWAAPWTPDTSVAYADRSVRPEIVWAALDCPSGIAASEAAGLGQDTAILLGQMTASVAVPPRPGDQCLVIAWPAGRDGRKLLAGSALLGPGGTVLATASAVWLTVPRPVPALAAEG